MSKKPNTKLESDDDRINDSFTDFRQRISAEQTRILSTVRKRPRKDIDFDITEHEVHKFLIIFHALMEEDIFNQSLSEQFEEVDGVVTDLLIKIVLKIDLKNFSTPNVRVRGTQWRRQNLRNVPARQAAAAAASQANQGGEQPELEVELEVEELHLSQLHLVEDQL